MCAYICIHYLYTHTCGRRRERQSSRRATHDINKMYIIIYIMTHIVYMQRFVRLYMHMKYTYTYYVYTHTCGRRRERPSSRRAAFAALLSCSPLSLANLQLRNPWKRLRSPPPSPPTHTQYATSTTLFISLV